MKRILAFALTGALLAPAGCHKGKKAAAIDAGAAQAAVAASHKTSQIPAPPDVAAPPKDATKTPSGLAYKVLKKGTGTEHPTAKDVVQVNYTGWTTDGKMFDSSLRHGGPATFALGGVIAGWTEGVQLMTVGEKTRFWIPQKLAYKGMPGKPKGMLVFDIELLHITKMPTTPKNVKAPPKDAKRTKDGLAYKFLKHGKGGDSPKAWDKVTVNYTGWTTDGKMFDSSLRHGRPVTFSLNGVIAGWTEGLQFMHTGDSARFWIPAKLAYANSHRPGAPKGMLVFDIDLLAVKHMPKPPPAPKHVAAPPKKAKKTKSGVYYVVLKKGTGKQKPTATSVVKVNYTGWTTKGKMFDSSITRGKPATLPLGRLSRIIPGWADAVETMTVGEKARFWIPQKLAYNGRPGAPKGMLVFDVELLSIQAGGGMPHPMLRPHLGTKPHH